MTTAEPQLLLPGFRVRRVIGAGGMGEVFEAEDLALGRPVAIKRLRSDRLDADSPHFGTWQARFRREAKLLAAVNHRNIAVVHSVLKHEGSLHMVMEYVDGRSLREALRAGPMSVGEALDVCAQVAAGLAAAHDAGVIHRDIKPDNIRIGRNGVVKILDFGLARQIGPEADLDASVSTLTSEATTVFNTRAGAFLGTAGYAAPEQVMGEVVDQRADVFAFGCVLYECLCGQRAFDARGKAGALAVMDDGPAWMLLGADTPDWLRELLRRCVARAPTDRLAGFDEVLAALRRHQPRSTASPEPGAPASPATAVLPNNLPRTLDRFVGRQAECNRICELLRVQRLVSIVGLGGSGKSRLALRAAEVIVASPGLWEREVGDGVVLVRLSGQTSRRQVVRAIHRAVDAARRSPSSGGDVDSLVGLIGQRRVLLLLDRCEQSARLVTEVLAQLLAACPNLRVLATSRERLGLPGEQVFPCGPLDHRPAADAASTFSRVRRASKSGSGSHDATCDPLSESAQLFFLRARQSAPDLAPKSGDIESAERLCARIGGWPLAIEIAASLADTLDVAEIDARVARGDPLVLQSGSGHDPEGAPLAAVIDWTLSRLGDVERALLERLSVFPVDFSLEGAERVGAAPEPDGFGPAVKPASVLSVLSTLVRKSLVDRRSALTEAESDTGIRTRFMIPGPIRETLMRRAEHAGGLRERLRDYCFDLVERAAPNLEGPRQRLSVDVIESEYPALHRTFEWIAASGQDLHRALEVASSLGPFWYKTWMASEGRQVIESLLAAGATLPGATAGKPTLMRACKTAGIMCWMSGDRAASSGWYARALEIASELADRSQVASISSNLGLLLAEHGDETGACEAHERALNAYTALGDRVRAAQAELNLAAAETRLGRIGVAKDRLARCLATFRGLGDDVRACVASSDLGEIELMAGNTAAASIHFRTSLGHARAAGSAPGQFTATAMLGLCAARAGDRRRAIMLLGLVDRLRDDSRLPTQSPLMIEALRTFRELVSSDRSGEASALAGAIGDLGGVEPIILESVVTSDGPVSQG